MCILADSEIFRAVSEGRIIIDPFDPSMVGPNSVDLRVGNKLLTHIISDEYPHIDPRKKHPMKEHVIPEEGRVLLPGECYLGSTIEVAGSDYYVPMLETRSGYARCTLSSHTSAGFGDVAFKRQWVLEITVIKPVLIRPGDSICQVYFQTLKGTVLRPYKGKHANQEGPTPSLIYKRYEAKS